VNSSKSPRNKIMLKVTRNNLSNPQKIFNKMIKNKVKVKAVAAAAVVAAVAETIMTVIRVNKNLNKYQKMNS
jgi:hypothetical protein